MRCARGDFQNKHKDIAGLYPTLSLFYPPTLYYECKQVINMNKDLEDMSQPSLEELTDNFALFDDWEERYKYLIDLGKALPPMADSLKTDETMVNGCTSQVWMICETDVEGRHFFTADSDAHIVRGLIAVLLSAYQGKTSSEIQKIDIEKNFQEIGLDQHLSPNRRNGFFAMVERIKALSIN